MAQVGRRNFYRGFFEVWATVGLEDGRVGRRWGGRQRVRKWPHRWKEVFPCMCARRGGGWA